MSEYEEQAEKFLKDTGFNLDINYKEFNSMPWDKDGQKRNIFEVELSKGDKSYKFDFGNSIVYSCKPVPKINTVKEVDLIIGFRMETMNYTYTYKLTVDIPKLRNLIDISFYNPLLLTIKEDMELSVERHIESFKGLSTFEKTLLRKKLVLPSEEIANLIRRRANRTHQDLWSEKVHGNIQLPDIVKPSSYDILARLYVCYYESPDDVVEEFGCMKPSQAIAIYEQDQELQKLFTEKELELLSEIN